METLFERLDKYMKFKGLNDNKITVQANLSNGIIGKARTRGALSQENLEKILLHFQDLNSNWLFRGNGEMLNDSDNINSSSDITNHIATFQDLIEYQRKEIKDLKNALIECKKKK